MKKFRFNDFLKLKLKNNTLAVQVFSYLKNHQRKGWSTSQEEDCPLLVYPWRNNLNGAAHGAKYDLRR